MPTVPRLNGPQVQQAGLPSARADVRTSLESFGGGSSLENVNRAAIGIGEQVQKIALEEKKKADDVATQDAYAELVRRKNAMMYDPKAGALARRGKDAFGVVDQYEPEFDKAADEIEKSLLNDDQRSMFKQMRTREKTELNSTLQRHIFGEAKAYDDQSTESALAAARDDALLNFAQPGKVDAQVGLQKSLIMAHAERNGLPPEWVKVKLAEAESKTHSGIITRMLNNGDDLAAKRYFEGVKQRGGVFTGEDSAAMERLLEEGSLRGESQRVSDRIVSKATDMVSAVEQARTIQDPKLRDEVTSRVKDYFSMQKLAENQRIEGLHKNATDIIDQTGSVDKIPPGVWSQFSLSERSALKAYAKAKKDGTDVETNWQTYYDLKSLASAPETRSKFLQTNLYELKAKGELGNTEFKELVNAQTAARGGDTKALDTFRSDKMIVDQALAKAGIDTGAKAGKKDAERMALFYRRVDEEQAKLQARTGKPATNEEMQGIVDGLMIEGVTKKGWFWDDKKRAFEIEKSDQMFEIDVDSIPASDRTQIEDVLRKRGVPITDKAVLALYGRKLSGMVGNGQ